MPTLEDLYDTAGTRLGDAATVADALPPAQRGALVSNLDRLVTELHTSHAAVPQTSTPAPDAHNLPELLRMAQRDIRTVLQLLPDPEGAPGPARTALDDATRAVSAVRDVIESHRSADRAPLTPYAYTFSFQPAVDYLTLRTSDLARDAGRMSYVLAQGAPDNVAEALESAQRHLSQASVFGRTSAHGADMAVGAFPLALPAEAVQAGNDPTHQLPARLTDDCERLSRVAFEALYDRTDHRMSGSDLQQLARWTAMSRLLSGRLLLQVAEQHPDTATAQALTVGANHLRDASRAWKQAADGWRRVVDVADPRMHPKLPPPSYDIVRRGQVVRLPQVVPHPAAVITHASVTRLGRLLYGPQWRLEDAARPPGKTRTATEILADTRGKGQLAATLYRLPASGRQLALAAPVAIQRAAPGLVTDTPEHRPAGLGAGIQWYPVHEHQAATLAAAYGAVDRAEVDAARAILRIADLAGTPVPRARLDAAAHRHIIAGPDQQGTPDRARVRQQERVAAAARAQSTSPSNGRHLLPPPALGPAAQPTAPRPLNSRGHSR